MAMRCERCGEHEATVRITRIQNGEKQEMHLCADCAAEEGYFAWSFEPQFPTHGLLGGLMEGVSGRRRVAVPGSTRCERCGRTYRDFAQTGFLGCADCYEVFDTAIEPLIKRMQGGPEHRGKTPRGRERSSGSQAGGMDEARSEGGTVSVEVLREELKEAVSREDYERAAELRDRIRELEAKDDEG